MHQCLCNTLEVEKVTYVYPHKLHGKIKWPFAITRLTAHITCGLMSDLEILCTSLEKSMVIHDTKCPYEDKVSFKQHKFKLYSSTLKCGKSKKIMYSIHAPVFVLLKVHW